MAGTVSTSYKHQQIFPHSLPFIFMGLVIKLWYSLPFCTIDRRIVLRQYDQKGSLTAGLTTVGELLLTVVRAPLGMERLVFHPERLTTDRCFGICTLPQCHFCAARFS